MTAKEEAEIKKIRAEHRNIYLRLFIDVFKYLVTGAAAIFLFVLIQAPESILNEKNSAESINRERSKIILELIKNNNENDIVLGLRVLEKTYPDTASNWIKDIIDIFKIRDEEKSFWNSIDLATNNHDKILFLEYRRKIDSLYAIKEDKLVFKAFDNGGVGSDWGTNPTKEMDSIDKSINVEKRDLLKLIGVNATH